MLNRRLLLCVGAILVGFLVNRGLRLRQLMSPDEKMIFNDQNCQLKGDMWGNEDMSLGKNSLLWFASSGDLSLCFTEGCNSSVGPLGVWVLDIKDPNSGPRQIPMENYPHKDFHGHGIYVSNLTDRLYVINHLGAQSTVEVLKIEYAPAVRLVHLQTVTSELFPRYGINDVAEGADEDEIYVTRWQPFSLPEGGTSHPLGLLDKAKEILSLMFFLLGVPWTTVYRCTVATNTCEVATDTRFISANGITISRDRSTVFVSDAPAKQIMVFHRTPTNGKLVLETVVDLPFGVDNLNWEEETGEILLGTMPDFIALFDRLQNRDTAVPGGLSVLRRSKGEDWSTRDVLLHDGKLLSQISSGVRYGGTVVLGSPFAKGLLICTQQTGL